MSDAEVTFPLMLFAAGFGTRMGALTADRPKPLIEVAGRPLIDHAMAMADGAGIARRVANAHYLGDQIAAHLAGTGVIVAREDPILDTGGGLKAALPLLRDDAAPVIGPVMTLNTDAVWTGANPLVELAAAWRPGMGALLLLLPAAEARSETGRSDFVIDGAGRLDWAAGREGALYLGAHILDSGALADFAPGRFSVLEVWRKLIAEGRVFGTIHRGGWCDVGHPGGIAEAEAMLAAAHG